MATNPAGSRSNGGGGAANSSSRRNRVGRQDHYRSRLHALASAEMHRVQSSGGSLAAGYTSDANESQNAQNTSASGVSTSLLDVAATTLQELGIHVWSSSSAAEMPQEEVAADDSPRMHYDGDQVEISLMAPPPQHTSTAPGVGESAVRVSVNGMVLDGDSRERRKSALSDKDTNSTATSDDDDDCFDDNNDAGQKKENRDDNHNGICSTFNRLPCIVLLLLLGLGAILVATIFGIAEQRNRAPTMADGAHTRPWYQPNGRPLIENMTLTSKPTPTPSARPTLPPTPGPTAAPTAMPVTPKPTQRPTPSPTGQPTPAPIPPFQLNRFGQLQYDRATQIHVAEGLSITSIGKTGESVPFTSPHATVPDSGTCKFHTQPDGAATFYDPVVDGPVNNGGGRGFHYCSNSEDERHGGVYCIAFDANCEVRDYAKRLGGRSGDGCGEPPGDVTTIWNCSGGKTPWNTWVSCEEDWDNKNGYCWQVDPYGRRLPQKIAQIPPGRLEAMATDDSGPLPVFYFTEDDDEGAVRRFTPSRTQIPAGWDTLHPNMESDDRGEVDFLVFDNEGTSGTFHWSTDIEEGRQSANDNYRWVEGIAFAMIDGQRTIFFVAKRLEKIFQLNLDTNTWESRSTNADIAGGGTYRAEPDHIYFYGEKWLFHAEDLSNSPGVYLQDVKANSFYTIFEDKDPVDWGDGEETTGIAVSPDGRCLIGCLQERGECFVVKRDDGGSFDLADQRRR